MTYTIYICATTMPGYRRTEKCDGGKSGQQKAAHYLTGRHLYNSE